jgi:hypothetical protein
METRINSADSRVPIQQCKGTMPGVPVACLIDSICQEDFSQTLSRIARELVITSEYLLDPPAINPMGVKVILKKGRFGDGKTLTYGDDFTISADGTRLTLLGENVPVEGEDIEIYYVVEVENQGP